MDCRKSIPSLSWLIKSSSVSSPVTAYCTVKFSPSRAPSRLLKLRENGAHWTNFTPMVSIMPKLVALRQTVCLLLVWDRQTDAAKNKRLQTSAETSEAVFSITHQRCFYWVASHSTQQYALCSDLPSNRIHLPYMYYHAVLPSLWVKRQERKYGDPPDELEPSCSASLLVPRSLKVTNTNTCQRLCSSRMVL